ncbi:hypothetical protein [Marinomonas colpomeniae]|uniref:Uncharacterized protein n=1 Tax=Marinomonas colpomeniae TaxID=2774408 RepID=A0ABR8P0C0_9GAMM|nr:hypothetical protein [Marinomonas colpomeniae]MBD5771749.1 hypothetical protein [Marinomonas colpomeniae]
MNKKYEDRYGKEHIERATNEIMGQFDLDYKKSKELAIQTLNGLDSHGCDYNNFETVKETITVVVSIWLENNQPNN